MTIVADIRAFRALRPSTELAARVAAPPYDVVDREEARLLAAGNPDSFLHVSRPEIDLADDVNPHSDAVHRRGRAALDDLVHRGVLVADTGPTLSIYRQHWDGHVQTGVVCCAAVEDYDSGVIRIHEHTRPDKEADRARHVDVLDAHDEPVFLFRLQDTGIDAVVARASAGPPDLDLSIDEAGAGTVRHQVWRLTDPALIEQLVSGFAQVPTLWVADGHHRSAAASRVHALRTEDGAAPSSADATAPGSTDAFLAVVFPADELTVLPYHRMVDRGDLTVEALLDALDPGFTAELRDSAVVPSEPHTFGMYTDGRWYLLRARPEVIDVNDPKQRLDVSLLQERVLEPLFGVSDPRTDERLRFAGGARGIDDLVRAVDAGTGSVAFSLYPTGVEELVEVTGRGEVMPPKSTWFEPKLRSGLFVHRLHEA